MSSAVNRYPIAQTLTTMASITKLIMDSLKKSLIKGENMGLINLYKRTVQPRGNLIAQKLLLDVFEIDGGYWRDIGYIPNSALIIKSEYKFTFCL